MTWVRTDDGMPLHPKILRLSDGAYRLWSNGLHLANRATTDGVIARDLVHTLDHRRAWTSRQMSGFVAEIVAEGLWRETAEGFEIHDYAHYQEEALKEVREDKRAQETLRKREWRAKKKAEKLRELGICPAGTITGQSRGTAKGQGVGQSTGQPAGHAMGQARATDGDAQPHLSQPPGPTRPDPAQSSLRSDSADAPEALSTELLVKRAFASFYESAKATLWPYAQAKPAELSAICAWVESVSEREKLEPEAVIARLMQHFAADEYVRGLAHPWSHFRTNFANYWTPAKPKTSAPAPTGSIGRGRYVY